MKYVCLEGIKHKNRFYTSHDQFKDPTRLIGGTVAYTVLGYAETSEEALRILHGPNHNDPMERFKRTANYLRQIPFVKELGITEKDILEIASQITLYEKGQQ